MIYRFTTVFFVVFLTLIAFHLWHPHEGNGRPAGYRLPPVTARPPLSEWEKNNVDVYDRAGKGVVHITSVALKWDYFYNVVPQAGTGSGAVIDGDGHIITNYHVIRNAQRLFVKLANNDRFQARVVGVDPSSDLAVIKIDPSATTLHPIPLGDSTRLNVGQKVLAIGNPFGLARTLTVGIISSLGRSLRTDDGRVIENLIQTDAAINPGNSGGPLLDSAGRIIGINTAIFSPSGGSVGIGFAVPVDRIRRVLPDLITTGRIRHPWLGVQLFTLTPDIAQHLGLPVREGAVIVATVPGGPAHRQGLRGGTYRVRIGNVILYLGGDIVTAIDGKPVKTSDDLIEALAKHRPGDTCDLTVVRGKGERSRLSVALGEQPDEY